MVSREMQALTDAERLQIADEVLERLLEEWTSEHADQIGVFGNRLRAAKEAAVLAGKGTEITVAKTQASTMVRNTGELVRDALAAKWLVQQRLKMVGTFYGYRCPACRSLDVTPPGRDGVRLCNVCEALFGDVTASTLRTLVSMELHPMPSLVENATWRYYDFRVVPGLPVRPEDEIGAERFHGWYDPESHYVMQTG